MKGFFFVVSAFPSTAKMSNCIIKSVSLHRVILLKAFREMIKGPALIAHLEKPSSSQKEGESLASFSISKMKIVLETHRRTLVFGFRVFLKSMIRFCFYYRMSCNFLYIAHLLLSDLGILKLPLPNMSTYLFSSGMIIPQSKKTVESSVIIKSNKRIYLFRKVFWPDN